MNVVPKLGAGAGSSASAQVESPELTEEIIQMLNATGTQSHQEAIVAALAPEAGKPEAEGGGAKTLKVAASAIALADTSCSYFSRTCKQVQKTY